MLQILKGEDRMETVRNYYEEIQECLNNEEVGKYEVLTINTFCATCQKYYYYHLIREKMKKAERVLKNYFDESEYMAQRKLDMDKEIKPSFSLVDKMYLEFLGEIYDEYYSDKMNYEEFINSNSFRENIAKCFIDVPNTLVNRISDIWQYAEDNNLLDYVYDRHDFSFIHNSISEVREALCMSMPSIDLCVEKVIVPELLEKIVTCLRQKNVPGAIFTIAPISRALSEGRYYSYTSQKGNTNVFFNISSDYNLKQLSKRIEDIKQFVASYEEAMNELNKYREISV